MTHSDHILQLYLSGTSQEIVAVRETIQRVLAWPTTSRPPHLVIEGESWTGKSLLVWWLHRNSALARRPFVRIYFPASPPYSQLYIPPIPEAEPKAELFNGERRIFQAAAGGTLVLDEPWLASKKIQAMLPAAIEELDAWIITETNRSLESSVRSGDLREDLYRRLTQLGIRLPPLREHREVILPLADYYLEQHRQSFGLPPRPLELDARSALLAYPWPGNLAELNNLLERIVLLCPDTTLTAANLAAHLPRAPEGLPSWWQ